MSMPIKIALNNTAVVEICTNVVNLSLTVNPRLPFDYKNARKNVMNYAGLISVWTKFRIS